MFDILILKNAARTTIICLISCLIGNWGVLALVQTNMQSMHEHHTYSSGFSLEVLLTMCLGMLIGLSVSVIFVTLSIKYQNKQSWQNAATIALNMSFFSMLLMMMIEYGVRFILQPNENTMNVIHSLDYFKDTKQTIISISAILAGYLVALTYNYYKLKKSGIACH